MEPGHHRPHRDLQSRRDVPVRQLLDVEKDDGLSRPLVELGKRAIEPPELLADRGLGFWSRHGDIVDRHRLRPRRHPASPEQVPAEPSGDGDEPGQDWPLRVESLEVDEGTNERLLHQVFRLGRANQSPAESEDRSLKTPHQLVKSACIATAGTPREVELGSSIVRIRIRGR